MSGDLHQRLETVESDLSTIREAVVELQKQGATHAERFDNMATNIGNIARSLQELSTIASERRGVVKFVGTMREWIAVIVAGFAAYFALKK